MVCVPITISSALAAAPLQARYQWKIADDGKTVVWSITGMGIVTESLTLAGILAHPEARLTRLGDS